MEVYYEPEFRPQRERVTWAVQHLILLNVAIFAAQLVLNILLGYDVTSLSRYLAPGGIVTELLAFRPAAFLSGFLWQPVTYQFLHNNLMHLVMNMLWLFFFGPEVERTLGTRQFYMLYVVCGVAAVLATLMPWFLLGRDVSVIGASGAVMAVVVAFAIVNPNRQFFLFPFPAPITARALVLIVIAMNLFWALAESGTSVATHFGGMAAGYLYIRGLPRFRQWQLSQRRRQDASKNDMDATGRIVDNIFRFDRHKRDDGRDSP
ncbi:MAG TPA: rhomboid family intramembrane serine protease [Candidatus Hydrogenedentes bacterium]|nr:rhomboid family intramembrane serine protease [Candidatus Hydrogenedentota bacterium]HPG69525.1 rhomboid family intramembrane serine protease [Candidatus Hydrogenedentota bacterium]